MRIRTKVVDYYRGRTGDPQGPGTGEPRELFSAGTVTLDWDQVHRNGTPLGPRSSSTHCNTVTSVPANLPANVVGGGSYVGGCPRP
ncbi:hypothetical protein AB0E04_25575 [Streptomyces sp. NPDC048251]|uniref:hypothetical protein n=1 Tax=Streptomyces sp. NPDC048251 TaxID=3154501 RepID=UPI00342C28E6